MSAIVRNADELPPVEQEEEEEAIPQHTAQTQKPETARQCNKTRSAFHLHGRG